jgi:hypothetical protein
MIQSSGAVFQFGAAEAAGVGGRCPPDARTPQQRPSRPFGIMDVCSFGILISFCSHRAPFLGPADDLVRGGLDVLRQHLGRRVPALHQYLAVGEFGVTGLRQTSMAE